MKKMVPKRNLIIGLSLLILMFLAAFIIEGESKSKEKSEKEKEDIFYYVNHKETIKYSFPNRPFDTIVTLEGIGWQNGKFIAVFETKFLNDTYYSYMPRFFSPTLEYKNKKYILVDKLWTEGALDGYKGSISRYAVTSKRSVFPKDFWPEKITVMGTEFTIPDPTSKNTEVPTFKGEKEHLYTINKSIAEDKLTYKIQSLTTNQGGGQLSLIIDSKDENLKEQNIFLLRDDQSRIYTFKKSSLPSVYQKGENTYIFELNQPVPKDIKTLEFLKFEDEFLQSHLFTSSNERSVVIIENY
ncbi:hypothetical protein [Neobacillus sp. D3-1R]|uniref:hypothetical protein n=1 Tax=Neobacillus sp. D3-1R TaxID=3445778 RepID=UPI003FA003CE